MEVSRARGVRPCFLSSPPPRKPRFVHRPGVSRWRVLWIDDQLRPDDATVRLMRLSGMAVDIALTAAEGLAMAASRPYDVILLDVNLTDMYGVTVVRRLRAIGSRIPVAMITGCYFEPEVEADARRAGAADFLHKPVDIDDLAKVFKAAVAAQAADGDVQDSEPECGIIAASSAMRDVTAWVTRIARGRMSVLLTGETGTGKEVVARAIHAASGRRGRFVPVNCGAIPEALFESELFGHGKGAFTGASEAKPGLVEEAHGGTLFLDEVGEMPLSQQVRLLRFLDSGELRRVGETRDRTVDVRVVAATNRDLTEQVARSCFREDLYFRLATVAYRLPPLRDRREDIEALTRYWVMRQEREGGQVVTINRAALDALRGYPWPGNVRELRNVLEVSLTFCEAGRIDANDVRAALHAAPAGLSGEGGIEVALSRNRWHRGRTARQLGVSRTTLWRRLKARDESG